MAYELTLHDLGEGLTEAEVIAWLVAVGEPVRTGDVLVEVETARPPPRSPPRDGVPLHQVPPRAPPSRWAGCSP